MLFDWDATEPEPVGTYFSANDFVPRGGDQVFLGFGAFSDQGTDFTPLGGPFIENFQAVPRGPTDQPVGLGPVRRVAALVPAGLQPGHRARLLLRQLPQQAAADQRPHRHAGRHRQFARHADARPIATAQGLASGLPFDTAVAIAANAGANAAARERRRPVACDRDAVRDDRRQHGARRRQRRRRRRRTSRPTSMRRPRVTSPSIRRTSSCSACRSTRSSARPASRCRARCPTARIRRCSSTTSNSCSPR